MRKPIVTEGGKEGGDGPTNVSRPPPQQQSEEADGGAKKEEEEEDAIKRELKRHMEENDGDKLLLAPKKPNWDLKRDVAKKMAKLDKLTKKAIVELLKEKLANQPEEDEDEDEDEEDDD